MRDFDPRWRLGFSALVLVLLAGIFTQHGRESLVMIEVGIMGLGAAIWTGWTGAVDLWQARQGTQEAEAPGPEAAEAGDAPDPGDPRADAPPRPAED